MEIKDKIPLVFGVPDISFFEAFKEKEVFVAELRPGLEGMRIVSREFLKTGVVPVIICDNMMAFCMQRGLVRDVHIFSSSIDKEKGICRTGSLIAALCARMHNIPVYMHASQSKMSKGSDLTKIGNDSVTIQGIRTYAPLLEEVPLSLVKA
jgi:methylthioribose-1-phosphate isomerase